MEDYFKKLKIELHRFIDNELHKVAYDILPEKERRYFETVDVLESIFIIEKYLYGVIYPQKWRIKYSSSFSHPKYSNTAKRFKQIEKFLKEGDIRINLKSFNYLPKSSRQYLKAHKSDSRRRYVVDFSNSFFGVKHLHLNQKHNDELIFYTNDSDTIYFLHSGSHKDIYDKRNVEIIINEFPDLLDILRIFSLPELMTGDHEYKTEEIKKLWESGLSVLLNINGTLYSGVPQTFSNITISNINTAQNLFFQLENQLEQILNHLKSAGEEKNIDLRLLRSKSKLSIRYGYICYRERSSGQEFPIYPHFLKNVSIANHLLSHLA